MNCADLDSLLTRTPSCIEVEGGARLTTHCLYPSSDPVHVFIGKRAEGFRVTDGGGAWRSALMVGKASESIFEKACRRHSVEVRGGILLATPPTSDWLYPAVLAVANASAMAARAALETYERAEKSLNAEIFELLSRHVPKHRIAKKYEYRGRSGHVWEIDFAVLRSETLLIKSVAQNGNSINSNYATFGDIGEQPDLSKVSVFDTELKQDSASLLRQVATLVPFKALEFTVLKGL